MVEAAIVVAHHRDMAGMVKAAINIQLLSQTMPMKGAFNSKHKQWFKS